MGYEKDKHATEHQNGGRDEVDVTGLTGLPTAYTNTEAQAALEGLKGMGHITIVPLAYQSIGQGTFTSAWSETYLFSHRFATTGVNLDNITYNVYLDKGTYTLLLIVQTDTDEGIVDVDIDAAEVASFSLYSASTVKNVLKIQTGISVAASGLKALKLRVDGAGTESGYALRFNAIILWRTA